MSAHSRHSRQRSSTRTKISKIGKNATKTTSTKSARSSPRGWIVSMIRTNTGRTTTWKCCSDALRLYKDYFILLICIHTYIGIYILAVIMLFCISYSRSCSACSYYVHVIWSIIRPSLCRPPSRAYSMRARSIPSRCAVIDVELHSRWQSTQH